MGPSWISSLSTLSRSPAAFAERWAALSVERGNLVLAATPAPKWLASWGLSGALDGAASFCESLLPAIEKVPCVKLQTPFFERFGPDGIKLLAWFTARIHEAGALVVIDAKRCDAADTMGAYSDLYLGRGSVIGADGVTAVPYMGVATLAPLIHRAAERGCAVFVLVRTSNHESNIQAVHVRGARSVSEVVAAEVAQINHEVAPGVPIGPVAAVVGAQPEEARRLADLMPTSLVSLPGLGRSGRMVDGLAPLVGAGAERLGFPVATGILSAGPHGVVDRVLQWRDELAHVGLASQR